MAEIREYLSASGASPYDRWFDKLDRHAKAKVTIALVRLEVGNTGSVKLQSKDIATARERWRDYQIRKRGDSCH